jgi:hypothetical protein
MTMVAGIRYTSATDVEVGVVPGVVVGPSPTARYVDDCEELYALEPAKLARI